MVKTGKRYNGAVVSDHYGRPVPKYAHGTGNISCWTSSTRRIMEVMMEQYDKIVDPDLLVRRVTIVAVNLLHEDEIPIEAPEQLDLFTDYDALEKKKAAEAAADDREKRLQKATLLLQASALPLVTTEPSSEITADTPVLPADSSFSIHFIDVGQADAALVECDGHYMLIDGGNKADSNVIYDYHLTSASFQACTLDS